MQAICPRLPLLLHLILPIHYPVLCTSCLFTLAIGPIRNIGIISGQASKRGIRGRGRARARGHAGWVMLDGPWGMVMTGPWKRGSGGCEM